MTRQELENKMAVLLGGRAAEHIVFGELSTGAADDLAKVTDIARSMVTRYGMTEELGQIVYERSQQSFLGGPQPMLLYRAQLQRGDRARDRRHRQAHRRRGFPPHGQPAAGPARRVGTRRPPPARARNPRRERPRRSAKGTRRRAIADALWTAMPGRVATLRLPDDDGRRNRDGGNCEQISRRWRRAARPRHRRAGSGRRACRVPHPHPAPVDRHEPGNAGQGARADLSAGAEIRGRRQPGQRLAAVADRRGPGRADLLLLQRHRPGRRPTPIRASWRHASACSARMSSS